MEYSVSEARSQERPRVTLFLGRWDIDLRRFIAGGIIVNDGTSMSFHVNKVQSGEGGRLVDRSRTQMSVTLTSF